VCQQDNTQKIFIQQFRADVKIEGSWNIPDCGEESIVFVSGLKGIVVGSYLWNPTYGYYEVTAFDISRGLVTLLNHCTTGNATAGTNVPGCTEFTNTVPPCDCGDDSQVCVAIDFTAPAEDACLDITLTNTTGITAGDTIQIGSGFYFLQAIKPNEVVTICNQGEGIAPGTPVIARDANDNYQYCISVISTNPCSRTPDYYAPVLACNDDGAAAPLDGSDYGWVVSMVEPTTNAAQYRPIGNPSICNSLSAALSIVNGTATYTNIAVESSADFRVGNVLVFSGYSGIDSGLRLTITSIPDSTHINGTFSPTPSANVTIPSGLICTVGCCEYITDYWPQTISGRQVANESASHLISSSVLTYEGPHVTWSIVNPDSGRSLKVHHTWQSIVQGTFNVATSSLDCFATIILKMNWKLNGGGTLTRDFEFTSTTYANEATRQDAELNYNWIDTVAAGATNTYELWTSVVFTNVCSTDESDYTTSFVGANATYSGHIG
jgi:hypothetical protein